jgi:hypothetical protein
LPESNPTDGIPDVGVEFPGPFYLPPRHPVFTFDWYRLALRMQDLPCEAFDLTHDVVVLLYENRLQCRDLEPALHRSFQQRVNGGMALHGLSRAGRIVAVSV